MSNIFEGPTVPQAGAPTTTSLPDLPGFGSAAAAPAEAPWDTLGRLIFGVQRPDFSPTSSGEEPKPTTDAQPKPFDIMAIPGELAAGAATLVGAPLSGIPIAATPIGWIEHIAGVDPSSQFTNLGAWMKTNDTAAYEKWQAVDAAAGSGLLGQFFGGDNLKSDFVREWGQHYADQTKQGMTGIAALNPELGFGPAGSLGGALADFLKLTGIPGLAVQRQIAGGRGDVQGDRVDQIVRKAQQNPGDLTNVEKAVVANVGDGSWTHDHALDFIVSHHEGLSDNGLVQLVGDVALDPVMIASLGAGAALKLGEKGAAMAEAGLRATTPIEHIAGVVSAVQKSDLAPVFRVARTLVDPLGAVGKSSVSRGMVDLASAAATDAVRRGYGEPAYQSLNRLATDLGFADKWRSSLGGYAANLARKWVVANERATQLLDQLHAAKLLNTEPDTVVGDLLHAAPKDAADRLTDYASRVKFVVVDDAQLASRARAAFGKLTQEQWAERIAGMTPDEKSLLHAATYQTSWSHFMTAVQSVAETAASKINLKKLVILNDGILDNVTAQELLHSIQTAQTMPERAALWNAAAAKYSAIADLGRAIRTDVGMNKLLSSLEKMLPRLHTRLTADEIAKLPPELQDYLASHPDWHLGFRPDEQQAWGLAQDAAGKYYSEWEPFVSNVTDMEAVPALQPVSDTIRNVLGQVVGTGAAGTISRPFDAAEVAIRTALDQVSGQRLMNNFQQRFIRNAALAGIGKPAAAKMWRSFEEMARTKEVQLQGLSGMNMWEAAGKIVPEGVNVGPRELMNMLLDATNGDLRIVGLSSGFTQRMRSMIARTGLPLAGDNFMGQLTVDAYNKLRYAWNLTFRLQAGTDAAFFNILHGVMPVGWGAFREGTAMWRMQRVLDTIGATSLAPAFALERPEYTALTTFRDALATDLAKRQGLLSRFRDAASSGNAFLRNNMIKQTYSNLGDAVKNAIDATAKVMGDTAEPVSTFAELRGLYSERAGRVLSDNEVGLRYLEDMFDDALGEVRTADGLLDYSKLIDKAEWHVPADIGELRPLNADLFAESLGFGTEANLRRHLAEGEVGIGALRDMAQDTLNAHPDYIDRMMRYLDFDWNDFWSGARASLDLSPAESRQVQKVISEWALLRDMTPAEYLTQVMATNGTGDVAAEVGKVLDLIRAGFARGGKEENHLKDLARIFGSHLDLSAQRALVQAFQGELPQLIQETMDIGKTSISQGMQRTLENLRGGWDGATSDAFAEAVARRASGEAIQNPDVERAVRYFAKWVKSSETAKPSRSLAGKYVMQLVDHVPTDGAFAYNRTEGLLQQAIRDRMRLAQQDAFRLAYAQVQRSVLERSLNHPFFGIYPSSYMWGKVFPELARFVAKQPFGIETGAMALATARTQESLAAQREYDPEFAALVDQIGASKSAFLLSYLTPSLPWDDMRAAAPPWLMSAAQNGWDIGKMNESEMGTISPQRWVKYFGQAGSELADLAQVPFQSQAQAPGMGTLQSIVGAGVTPAPPPPPSLRQPISGANLSPVLTEEMQQLHDILSQSAP